MGVIMVLFIFTHVAIALTSIAFSTLLVISPVASRFKAAYGLIAATLISGVGLVVASHSDLVSACRTGIAYLVIVSGVLAVARMRLAHQTEE